MAVRVPEPDAANSFRTVHRWRHAAWRGRLPGRHLYGVLSERTGQARGTVAISGAQAAVVLLAGALPIPFPGFDRNLVAAATAQSAIGDGSDPAGVAIYAGDSFRCRRNGVNAGHARHWSLDCQADQAEAISTE